MMNFEESFFDSSSSGSENGESVDKLLQTEQVPYRVKICEPNVSHGRARVAILLQLAMCSGSDVILHLLLASLWM